MQRYYLSSTIAKFLSSSTSELIGKLVQNSEFNIEITQRLAWEEEITILREVLQEFSGALYFEYSIPRMGRRIDVVCLIDSVIFVLEFKIGEQFFYTHALDQVMDYALDLLNFHQTSHDHTIAPILFATKAEVDEPSITRTFNNKRLFLPIKCNQNTLRLAILQVLHQVHDEPIRPDEWEVGRYSPTPTIVEAAMALYRGHSVSDISRSDASAKNLSQTSEAISKIIKESKGKSQKAICFVTGVPGSGKTLVGLDIATKHVDSSKELYSVFISGNGPLVAILREALARDKVRNEKARGNQLRKGEAMSKVRQFIQNVHHFRDECLIDKREPPEHVVLFDEAQRAWNQEQLTNFMNRKKHYPNFNQSEPQFLISCLDRHKDWAVIVCLVGGGQEINTGEVGIGEWIDSLNRSFPDWHIHISSRLTDSEYGARNIIDLVKERENVFFNDDLHLAVSMRSFRAENVSLLVKQILDIDIRSARSTLASISNNYPIVLTRNFGKAKRWLKEHAHGTERYGIVVSSQAERLKPYAIDVKSPVDPIHWFLDGKEDVRSSYYLEDVATEFDVQGLELDWACVAWDADFRYSNHGWVHRSFVGDRWNQINKAERQIFQKNAYRVLLTRARQGMVIVVPDGDPEDPTRKPEFYDPTYDYLKELGFSVI